MWSPSNSVKTVQETSKDQGLPACPCGWTAAGGPGPTTATPETQTGLRVWSQGPATKCGSDLLKPVCMTRWPTALCKFILGAIHN